MITRVFVVIALFACNLNAAPIQPSPTSKNRQDLQVITLDSQGNPAMRIYYSYDQLLTLPTVTVKTERDLNTNTPATYTGIYFSDLFASFGADASFDVIGANCMGGYKQYYDRDYVTRHRPILLLKFNDTPLPNGPNRSRETCLDPTAWFTNHLSLRKRSTATSKNQEARPQSPRLN
jgi:hypothetical protein